MLKIVVGAYVVDSSEPQRGGEPLAPGAHVVRPRRRPFATASKPWSPTDPANLPPRNVQ